MMEHYGNYVRDGAARFERYFRKKGWFGFGSDEDGSGAAPPATKTDADGQEDTVLQLWQAAAGKYKVVVEVALAYAITKATLPLRVIASVWATPWFAGVLLRMRRLTLGR
jgi:hypothetical protein